MIWFNSIWSLEKNDRLHCTTIYRMILYCNVSYCGFIIFTVNYRAVNSLHLLPQNNSNDLSCNIQFLDAYSLDKKMKKLVIALKLQIWRKSKFDWELSQSSCSWKNEECSVLHFILFLGEDIAVRKEMVKLMKSLQVEIRDIIKKKN